MVQGLQLKKKEQKIRKEKDKSDGENKKENNKKQEFIRPNF